LQKDPQSRIQILCEWFSLKAEYRFLMDSTQIADSLRGVASLLLVDAQEAKSISELEAISKSE
jgi:hypothetical protein